MSPLFWFKIKFVNGKSFSVAHSDDPFLDSKLQSESQKITTAVMQVIKNKIGPGLNKRQNCLFCIGINYTP